MKTNIIQAKIKSYYTQIENYSKKNPVDALTYSVALKIISSLICPFFTMTSNFLFLFSLVLDYALITNYKLVYNKLKYKLLEKINTNESFVSRFKDFCERKFQIV